MNGKDRDSYFAAPRKNIANDCKQPVWVDLEILVEFEKIGKKPIEICYHHST